MNVNILNLIKNDDEFEKRKIRICINKNEQKVENEYFSTFFLFYFY